MNLGEQAINEIKERNARVELDKAWETSYTRKISLTIITYIVIVIVLVVIKNDNPFINGLVPAVGYFLSTQSLQVIKKYWVRSQK